MTMMMLQQRSAVMLATAARSAARRSLPRIGAAAVVSSAPKPSSQQPSAHKTFSTMATTATTVTTPVYDLTEQELQWQSEGILDARGLVNFDTLHNMQVRSCLVFADKDLFGTFSPTTQNFEWMTYAECE